MRSGCTDRVTGRKPASILSSTTQGVQLQHSSYTEGATVTPLASKVYMARAKTSGADIGVSNESIRACSILPVQQQQREADQSHPSYYNLSGVQQFYNMCCSMVLLL
jgi:hypothetical protein